LSEILKNIKIIIICETIDFIYFIWVLLIIKMMKTVILIDNIIKINILLFYIFFGSTFCRIESNNQWSLLIINTFIIWNHHPWLNYFLITIINFFYYLINILIYFNILFIILKFNVILVLLFWALLDWLIQWFESILIHFFSIIIKFFLIILLTM